MKKYILIIVTLLIISCTDREDENINYNFKIENNSGYDIIITSYNSASSGQEILRTIEINNNSFFIESYSSRASERSYILADIFRGDSIVVSYNNNERKEIFTCIDRSNTRIGCDEARNPLNYSSTIPSINNNLNTIYTFAPSDYDNAND